MIFCGKKMYMQNKKEDILRILGLRIKYGNFIVVF